ncbi:hypothetical protein LTR62_005759 [Meristemomyces frigidus]|uniref:Uncharacterized protein n=1 Tax=Meristemomyces frigidus TaxID=1508187 RepID=A0AAN7TP76_9PEZI|nr:hypothetical protein LTR62_005759 [Meristemomyces frigidus]
MSTVPETSLAYEKVPGFCGRLDTNWIRRPQGRPIGPRQPSSIGLGIGGRQPEPGALAGDRRESGTQTREEVVRAQDEGRRRTNEDGQVVTITDDPQRSVGEDGKHEDEDDQQHARGDSLAQ